MKKSSVFLVFAVLLILIGPVAWSVESVAEGFLQSDPQIAVDMVSPIASEQVHIAVKAEPRVGIEDDDLDFNWIIYNQTNEAIYTQTDVAEFDWIPDIEGTYTVNCTVSYLNESKSVVLVVVLIDKQAYLLEQYTTNILGTWTGTATTPWRPPYEVEIEFFEDGTYSARNPNDGYVAFYYGDDVDSDMKTYSINDVMANGKGTGTLFVYFTLGDHTCRGDLENIEFTQDFQHLEFEFWYRSQYGPIKYSLEKSAT